MFDAVLDRIRAPVRWVLFKGLFLLSPRLSVHGIEVIDVAEEESERTFRSLREALRVVEKVDNRRYHRLKRDLGRIVLVKAGGPEFASEVGACIIRSRYVRESTPAAVATTLVHEATHARLCRLGIGYGPSLRGRVEEICVKEQIAFAERLGEPGILTHLKEKLQEPWWTRSQLHERRIAAWRELGLPEWTIRCYERVVYSRRNKDRPSE